MFTASSPPAALAASPLTCAHERDEAA
jgi:hypothetical protein